MKTNVYTKTNKAINGETVSYLLVAFISVFLFFTLKQLLKIFIGIPAGISVSISFTLIQIFSYLLEKRFVFVKSVLSSLKKQIFMLLFRSAVNIGFYKLSQFFFGDILKLEKDFYWFITITLCVVFNYFFDRLLVFDCNYDAESIKKSKIYIQFFKYRYVLFAGFLSACALLCIFMIYTAFPFGENTVMRMDLYHQYGPLFAELYQRVVDGKLFIYSWISGGGSSFLGNYFNYLSSPITALIFLFDKKDISFAITFLALTKCILSSISFSYYLKKSFKKDSYFISIFGLFYSFSAYFLAYYWNIMWLDGMMLFPIIILGIERIINNGKCLTYIISLVFLFYSSYYMAYMCCIFSVIYFTAYFFMNYDLNDKYDKSLKFKNPYSVKALKNSRFYNSGFRFAGASIIAACICAVSLVSVYMILKSSSATSDEMPKAVSSYFDIFNFITSHLAGITTTIRSSGDDVLPNVYSGVLTCILVPLYIVNKRYSTKEKAIFVSILLFLLISFDNNYMNFIWHAFHFPNDLPYRFSYIYSFILLVIAYKSVIAINELDIRDIGFVSMGWLFFIILAQRTPTTKMESLTVYLSIGCVLLWTAFLFIYRNRKRSRQVLSIMLVLLAFCEVLINGTSAVNFSQSNNEYKKDFDSYTSAINTVHEDDSSFYREELCYLERRMDPCYFGYNGMSNFSSMANEEYSSTQYDLGMMGNRINSYTYNPQTPVYNLMFGIKYLYFKNAKTVPSENLYDVLFTSDDGQTTVYENKYFLPLSYCVNSDVKDWDIAEDDPFSQQSAFFSLATGYSDVFKEVIYTKTSFDGMSGENLNTNGTFWFVKNDVESNYGYANFTISPQIDGNVYIYVSTDNSNELSFTSEKYGQKTIGIEDTFIIDLGYYDAGDLIDVSLNCSQMDSSEGYAEVYAYSCDESVLARGYNKLSKSALNVTKHTDTVIEGTVNVKEDSYLYSSIPYDKGWSVYIDGEKTDTFTVGNSLLTVAIKHGDHTVRYKYTPQGLKIGAIISAVSIAGICIYTVYKTKQKKREFDTVN